MVGRKSVVADGNILVTGGASGIGLELCKCFIADGARSLSVLDISRQGLERAVRILQGSGRTKVITFQVDVTNQQEVGEAVAKGCHDSANATLILCAPLLAAKAPRRRDKRGHWHCC